MLRRFICISCAAILAAIAGVFTAAPANAAGSAAPSTLTGETLTATNYFFQGGVFTCNPSGNTTFTLVVNGTATGPYPGTFSETATVTIGPQPPGLVGPVTQFDASFTVDSPAGTVSGTKHVETATSPAAGQCTNSPTVPNPVCPPIAAEIFALDANYDATINSPTGTFTDHGLSHVSFQGEQEQCVEAPLNNGTFDESFTSAQNGPRCGTSDDNGDDQDRGDRGKGDDRNHGNDHGNRHACQQCPDDANADAAHSCGRGDGNGGNGRRRR